MAGYALLVSDAAVPWATHADDGALAVSRQCVVCSAWRRIRLGDLMRDDPRLCSACLPPPVRRRRQWRGGGIRGWPGIYVITHLPTGRRYVGSATDPRERWNAHRGLLRTGRHWCQPLLDAVEHGGLSSLRFTVVEWVPPERSPFHREAWWIRTLGTQDASRGFNIR